MVGETWEGWTILDKAIARSPHMDLIERVDRYMSDEELATYVARADAIVLPYHRSSLSGLLPIGLTAGLPVVVTAVGRLVEVVRDYADPVLVPPRDPAALRDALLELPARRGQRYPNPHSWQQTLDGYRALIAEVCETRRSRSRTSASPQPPTEQAANEDRAGSRVDNIELAYILRVRPGRPNQGAVYPPQCFIVDARHHWSRAETPIAATNLTYARPTAPAALGVGGPSRSVLDVLSMHVGDGDPSDRACTPGPAPP